MPDVELLQLTMKIVEESAKLGPSIDLADMDEGLSLEAPPEHLGWNQNAWINVAKLPEGFCLTAGCFAGHVVMHEGFTQPVMSSGVLSKVRNPTTGQELDFGAGPDSVPAYAQRALGLDPDQGERLFNGSNDLWTLRGIVEDLCLE